jgi:hypothetical protein
MDGYLIVAESIEDGTWWGSPNSFPTESEAVAWARTERKPPAGYAWMIYRLAFDREASELST